MLNHIWLWMVILSILIAGGTDLYNEAVKPESAQTPAGEVAFYTLDNVGDTDGLVARIAQGSSAADVRIRSLLSPRLRAGLSGLWKLSHVKASDSLKKVLLGEINRIVRNEKIYDNTLAQESRISAPLKKLLQQPLAGQELAAANRRLLSELYKHELVRKPNLNTDTKMGRITSAAIDAAGLAVKISIGLIGVMALWLGIMKVAEEAGAIRILAKAVRPITRRLFPSIPSEHPAVGAMVMNIAANMMGLSNAATPLGLKAMEELDKLNPKKGEATDDMITFLVINTSAITVIPATAIAIRASMGSTNPQQIVVPAILAATMATIVGVSTVKLIQYFDKKRRAKTEKEA